MQANIFSAFSKPRLPVITSEKPQLIQDYQWGLIPSWVKNLEMAEKISNSTYNARAESIFEKASFKKPAQSQRCLVLSHGFFEWHTRGKQKFPFYIKRKDNQAFAFAGLFDEWINTGNSNLIKTVTIITTTANPLLKKIHNTKNRMPVILEQDAEQEYIDKGISDARFMNFLKPFDEEALVAYPIDKKLFLHHKDPLDPNILKPVNNKFFGEPPEATLF